MKSEGQNIFVQFIIIARTTTHSSHGLLGYGTMQSYNPEDCDLNLHSCENLKSCNYNTSFIMNDYKLLPVNIHCVPQDDLPHGIQLTLRGRYLFCALIDIYWRTCPTFFIYKALSKC